VDSEDDSDREEDMCGEWHGNAKGDTTSAGNNTKTKQTGLMIFFTKPVKCLTDVLMTGAKQMSKKKATLEKNKLENSKKSGKRWRGQWRSNNSQRGECPAFKRITGTDFICDGFYYSSPNLSSNYFLTHFHSDHYGGITKNWNDGTMYCSLPTANLVHRQLGVEKRFLHPLPMNTPFVVVSEKGGKHAPVTVTLLDANHCPGAIMFLFEVGNRRILHVGDFRWNNELHMRMPQLRSLGCGSPRLDELYLDTTYCAEKYTLPTQAEAIDAAIEVATKEVNYSKKNASNKTLFLFGAYTIGKERIYLLVCGRAFQNEGVRGQETVPHSIIPRLAEGKDGHVYYRQVRNMPVGSPARVSQSRSNAGIPGRVEQNEGVHGPVPTRGRIQAHWVDVQAQVEG